MILENLYTTPKPLFENITFNKGLNIIYAHFNEDKDNSSGTLHAVGKSLLLDFILFALLMDVKYLRRIVNAYNKGILKGSSINLIFSVNNKKYKISRSFDNPQKNIYFGELGHQRDKLSLKKIQSRLFQLLFYRDDFVGVLQENWYNKLIAFFIKVKKREELFTDPINFVHKLTLSLATPFHLSLLNIDNNLPMQNHEITSQISNLISAKNISEKVIRKNSETKSITELLNKKTNLQKKVSNINNIISTYSLSGNYKELELRANYLTASIKKFWFQNSLNYKRIEEIKKLRVTSAKDTFNWSAKVFEIYQDINSLLANSAKKSIEEAVEFRKKLYSSRKGFIKADIEKFKTSITVADEKIAKFEKERQEIFEQLSKLKAFDDLKSAYNQQSKLQNEIFEIDKSLNQLEEINSEIEDLTTDDINLEKDVNQYLSSISNEVNSFRNLITSVFDKLFLDSHNAKIFNISETDSKQKINPTCHFGMLRQAKTTC
ncbi:MAG: hypothetical protein L3J08_09210 [Flavobacteriaceae bacterium]|nr:hypothetical protein [Flavobacteriaceae bacterium]